MPGPLPPPSWPPVGHRPVADARSPPSAATRPSGWSTGLLRTSPPATLSVTVIAGAEAIRSSRARRAAGCRARGRSGPVPADPVVGDDHPGIGPGEAAIGLIGSRPRLSPVREHHGRCRAGHDATQHRQVIGALFAPFTAVAASHPIAWFPEARSATEIATPTPDNRIVAEPYTKLMSAFLGSDQGAALVVCSLAAAREGRGRRPGRVRLVRGRGRRRAVPDRSSRSRALAGHRRRRPGRCSRRPRAAAGPMAGVGIDDVDVIDLYSCFPSAVEAGRRRAGAGHRRLPGPDRHRRAALLRGPGQQLHDPRRSPPSPTCLRDEWPHGARDRRGATSGPGHRAGLVHHQARPRPLRDRATPRRVPPGGHHRRSGRHRRDGDAEWPWRSSGRLRPPSWPPPVSR